MNLRNAILVATAALGLNFILPSTAEARDHRHHRHYGGHHRSYSSYHHHHSGRGYYSSRPRVIYAEPRYYYYDDYPRYRHYSRPRNSISFSFGGSHWRHW